MAVLSALPISASALGLGKLSVKSALGEPLRAEIDISSINPEESSTLQVRVASPETYRAAGVDYNSVLSGANIVLQRRADGRPYLRISSDRPVQEPFVDVILDLGWSAGRLVREYTLLFDPPSMRAVAQPAAPVVSVPPASTAVATSPALKPSRPAAVPPSDAQAPAAKSTPAAPRPAPVAKSSTEKESVAVRRGDTLSSIASRNLPTGVSLDQMLVGLYRQNPGAFQGDNMNRLRSGAVLTLPSEQQLKAVSPSEARQFIVAQSADFATYRQRLAGAVGVEATTQTQRQAKGKVEAEVQDRKQAAAPTPDKLTLSKGSVSSAASAAEDRLAKARATQDTSTRVAELSKNLDELRKLKEQAATVAAASQPAVAPVLPAVASQAAQAASVASAAASATELAASAAELVASAASEAASVAETASEVMAPVAVASKPDVAPVPPVVAQDEPGFLASLNPMWLAAGGAGLALLAGAAMFLRSRRRADTGETSFLESRLQPDSFFGASGGQRVDTRDATAGPSSMSYSLSQLDAIGDVDPVAEADVYLAYGRDLQAEEILKEALRSTPDRLAVRVKLLEVYAKRRDTKGYESLATQLFALTNGAGEEWLKTQELGLSIDPENPLYQPGGQPGSTAAEAAAPDFLGASTVPHSIAPGVADAEPAPADALVDLDLDANGRDSHQDGVTDSVSPQVHNGEHLADLELPDLDSLPSGEIAPAAAPANQGDIDFDLSIDDLPQVPAVAAAPAAAPVSEPTPSGSMPFDLGDITLDLDAPAPAKSNVVTEEELDQLPLADLPLSADPMARKFDLAQEFRQIGDVDGARELLQEVVDNAQDGSLKSRAQAMLDSLG
ncbi:FimV/HubP family polar landmark protein [Aquabacterium sp.]|uniref:FimV/HubP family polar landmark protein n=1 Tax=Aquabacterium sp. TaxID=1872578 RepID=UPI002A35D924|nr:FimV/HubP family polar landmark protein [Aquabacterium sp.]